jgi:hypothetical protein
MRGLLPQLLRGDVGVAVSEDAYSVWVPDANQSLAAATNAHFQLKRATQTNQSHQGWDKITISMPFLGINSAAFCTTRTVNR